MSLESGTGTLESATNPAPRPTDPPSAAPTRSRARIRAHAEESIMSPVERLKAQQEFSIRLARHLALDPSEEQADGRFIPS